MGESQSLDTAPNLRGLIAGNLRRTGRVYGNAAAKQGPPHAGIAVPACPFTTMSKR
jgi:hypothetical protein